MLINPPLSLYVHLPWCVRKCPYCDFNSHAIKGDLPEAEYAAALLRDLQQDLPRVQGRQLQSVFFGGGTPSLFRPETIALILDETRKYLPLIGAAEITLEANPGTVERGRFAEYRAAGVTRLSIGVQSFNTQHLQILGRIHSAKEASNAAEEAHAAGLDNFNLDLMYGLPQQTLEQALADVRNAIALAPAHLSHYQLTLEPNTFFHAHPPTLPDDEIIWQMQQECQALLCNHSFNQYEISAYARNGQQCSHNLNYWRYGDYLGIGAGAHSKLSDLLHGRILRLWKVKQPSTYLRTAGTVQGIGVITDVAEADRIFEFMLNRLRLYEGFSAADFESVTHIPYARVQPSLEQAQALKLMQMNEGRWQPTLTGYTYLNDLQARFLPEASAPANLSSRPTVRA
ncbi:MAG TPA: radical SAM family heme chaperone HemW [Gammaproteobacteria bacterium]|nr:radical SAM family heme chaperone HemW [Gammaproteobacteria bacterium]